MIKKYFSARFGFTLIELLIAIAIVGIIAVVAFVALDPARRFAEARNATRWTNVAAILDGIKLQQVDAKGVIHANLTAASTGARIGAPNMIASSGGATCTGGGGSLARTLDLDCDIAIAATNCVDLSYLTTGSPAYLAALPRGPLSADAGRIDWPNFTPAVGAPQEVGYYLIMNGSGGVANGGVTVGSCDGERESDTPRRVISITK